MEDRKSGRRKIGDVAFDPASGELRGDAGLSKLEPRAACVLELLCDHAGSVVSRQQLLDGCWGEGGGSDEALTQAVAQIRRAMGQSGASQVLIQTHAKRGYRLQESGAGPAVASREAGNGERRALIAASLILLLLLGSLLAFPHGARHAFRHAVGLGPGTQAAH